MLCTGCPGRLRFSSAVGGPATGRDAGDDFFERRRNLGLVDDVVDTKVVLDLHLEPKSSIETIRNHMAGCWSCLTD